MLPQTNEVYTDFVLNYATDGLDSLVRKIGMNDTKDHLEADLQPDLIQAFATKFPEADLKELDNVVEWILVFSIANKKEKNE
jgi:hypothetical protein